MITTHLYFFFFSGGESAPLVPIPVRFTTGFDTTVIPVEVVTMFGDMTVPVSLYTGSGNYVPIREDRLHPKRVKVMFVA